MFSYKGLEKKLNERNIGRSDLTKRLGLSSRTVAKIGKGDVLTAGLVGALSHVYPDTTFSEMFC